MKEKFKKLFYVLKINTTLFKSPEKVFQVLPDIQKFKKH